MTTKRDQRRAIETRLRATSDDALLAESSQRRGRIMRALNDIEPKPAPSPARKRRLVLDTSLFLGGVAGALALVVLFGAPAPQTTPTAPSPLETAVKQSLQAAGHGADRLLVRSIDAPLKKEARAIYSDAKLVGSRLSSLVRVDLPFVGANGG